MFCRSRCLLCTVSQSFRIFSFILAISLALNWGVESATAPPPWSWSISSSRIIRSRQDRSRSMFKRSLLRMYIRDAVHRAKFCRNKKSTFLKPSSVLRFSKDYVIIQIMDFYSSVTFKDRISDNMSYAKYPLQLGFMAKLLIHISLVSCDHDYLTRLLLGAAPEWAPEPDSAASNPPELIWKNTSHIMIISLQVFVFVKLEADVTLNCVEKFKYNVQSPCRLFQHIQNH